MVRVPVVAIEDVEAGYRRVPLPEDSEYEFYWDDSVDTRVRDPETLDRFRRYLAGEEDESWGTLTRPAIVTLDLGLVGAASSAVIALAREWLSPDFQPPKTEDTWAGLYLLGGLMQTFTGVVCIATGARADAKSAQRAYEKKWPPRADLGVCYAEGGLYEQGGKLAEEALKTAVAAFKSIFGSVENRLWPPQTEDWFSRSGRVPEVPHNPPVAPAARLEASRHIDNYLTRLMGIAPPRQWLDESQFRFLYDDLKHLVGACAVAHGSDDADLNLTLGSVLLLLAAASRDHAGSWLSSIAWTSSVSRRLLVPTQDRERARSLVRLLAGPGGLFSSLVFHEESAEQPELSNRYLVEHVGFTPDALTLTLDHDFSEQRREKRNRPTLIQKLAGEVPESGGGHQGGVFQTIQRTRGALGSSSDVQGYRAMAVLNLYARAAKTYMEIRCFAPSPTVTWQLHELNNELGKLVPSVSELKKSLTLLRVLLDVENRPALARMVGGLVTTVDDALGDPAILRERIEPALLAVEVEYGGTPARPESHTAAGDAPDGFLHVLIADDDGILEHLWAEYFGRKGYAVTVATEFRDAMQILHADPPAVFICDVNWKGREQGGRELMQQARHTSACRVVVAVSAMPLNQEDYPEADHVIGGVGAKTIQGAMEAHQFIMEAAHAIGQ